MAANKTNRKLEATKPEEAAALIDTLTDPLETITSAAERCGLPKPAAQVLARRLRGEYKPLADELRNLKTPGFIALIEEKAAQILGSMDEFDFNTATLRDKATAFGILIDKRQLLSGEPTQVISVQERQSLSDLIPALAEEFERRNMTVDLTPGGDGVLRPRAEPSKEAYVRKKGKTPHNAVMLSSFKDR